MKERDMSGNRTELSDAMKQRLKAAVKGVPAPPHLETRVRAMIREERKPRWWAPRLMAVAAAVVVAIGSVVAYELGHLRFTIESQDSYIAALSNRIATVMRAGLRDHIHCAVFRKFPKDAPTLEQASEGLGAEYKELAPVVTRATGRQFRLMLAHECGYLKRRYVHLALRSDSALMSVVITRKGEGESFHTEGLPPAFLRAGTPFYEAGVRRFQIAAFETATHLVYLVSDAPRAVNSEMLASMAPGITAVLQRLRT